MAGQHGRQRRHADALAAERVTTILLEAIAGVDVRQVIGREIADRAGVIGSAIERLVVDDDGNAIRRQLHIELQAVGAEGEAIVECHHRVLRSEPRAAAVGKHQRSGRRKHGHGHPRMFAWGRDNPKDCRPYTRIVRAALDVLAGLVAGFLPRRHWPRLDLPIADWATLSGMLTLLAGCALGITGFFVYMARMLESAFFVPSPYMLVGFAGYVFFTPRGLFSLYLVGSGLARALSGWIGEAFGDPLLTGLDHAIHSARTSSATRSVHAARTRAEGADEPDRRYPGGWADLPDIEFVIVAARRKPDWTAGTFIVTADGWFTLGQPFDRPMPQGIRTIYPLAPLTTMDVMRRGVAYDLPPLRPDAPRRRIVPPEPPHAPSES